MHRRPDGGLTWTTPGGDTFTTHRPRYGTDDNLPPSPIGRATPGVSPPRPISPPLTPAERILGRPRPHGVIDDDPPPF
jgi:hypothetical protein